MRKPAALYGVCLAMVVLGTGFLIAQGRCRARAGLLARVSAQPAEENAAQGANLQVTDKVEKAIVDAAKQFMEAFNRQDVKAIVGQCTEDCEFTERDGTTIRGRKEIEAEFKEAFAENPSARISLSVESVRLLTPNVAIEEGKTVYFADGKTATRESRYHLMHVRNSDTWLMAQGRTFEHEILAPYAHLRDLEWLIGDWVDEGPESLVETSYRWNENKTFLLQEFSVKVNGKKVLRGTQRIGWDPLTKHIKGWVFDSEGGNGEGLWSLVDGSWIIKAKGVRPDGNIMTATNELTKINAERMVFRSVDRIVGDERMPDMTVTVVRKPPQAKR